MASPRLPCHVRVQSARLSPRSRGRLSPRLSTRPCASNAEAWRSPRPILTALAVNRAPPPRARAPNRRAPPSPGTARAVAANRRPTVLPTRSFAGGMISPPLLSRTARRPPRQGAARGPGPLFGADSPGRFRPRREALRLAGHRSKIRGMGASRLRARLPLGALAPRGALPPSAPAGSETTWRGFSEVAGDSPAATPFEPRGRLSPPDLRRALRGARLFGVQGWAQACGGPAGHGAAERAVVARRQAACRCSRWARSRQGRLGLQSDRRRSPFWGGHRPCHVTMQRRQASNVL